jgi:hypothetical protein
VIDHQISSQSLEFALVKGECASSLASCSKQSHGIDYNCERYNQE